MTLAPKYYDSGDINVDQIRIKRQRGKEDEKHAPTPEEGARLIRAFHRVKSAAARDAIIKYVEELSRNDS